ncbi:unnamed protein product, partial [marine sediment metagenome]
AISPKGSHRTISGMTYFYLRMKAYLALEAW